MSQLVVFPSCHLLSVAPHASGKVRGRKRAKVMRKVPKKVTYLIPRVDIYLMLLF